jgi:hypothetical protein
MGLTFDMHISLPVRILLALFLAGLLVWAIVFKMKEATDVAEKQVEAARSEYAEAVDLTRRLETLKAVGANKSVVLDERLFSYVEKVARDLKLEDRIDSIRPENRAGDDGSLTEVVHLAFKGIPMDDFVRFLYRVEVRKREISIRSISIRKDDARNLDTQMTLHKRG